MSPLLRIVLIVLVILLGAGAAMWRTNRYVEPVEPENPEPHIQKSNESLRELDEAVQKLQEARDQANAAVGRPVEVPVPPAPQRD